MQKRLRKFLPLAIMFNMLLWGCAQTGTVREAGSASSAAAMQEATVYKGKIIGKSRKAKAISIEVGKGDAAKTMMFKYDENTVGLEFAEPGEAAIINWEMRGSEKYATIIKPKLAKLPEGVAEIGTKALIDLLGSKEDLVLIDSRPAKRYAQSHLPGALSLPIDEMAAQAALILPKEKDRQLIFYCGGPT